MMKVLPLLLMLLARNGLCLDQICVKSGEMVALHCPKESGQRARVTWRPPQQTELTSSMSSTDHDGVLLHNQSLVILSAAATQQGIYSCSQGSSNKTFKLTVYTKLSHDCEKMTQYATECFIQQSCTLYCPVSNTPLKSTTSLTSRGITWQMDGKTWSKDTYHFTSVKESNKGIYICTRSYLYHGQTYNMTFTVTLDVKPKETVKNEGITEPRPDQVFLVDLGSPLVINCTAVIYSEFDEVFWLFDSTKNHSRIYSTSSSENISEGIKMTAHLVFKHISKEDLSTVFTCKLESVSQASISINVTLSQRVRTSHVGVTVCSVVASGVMIITVVIYFQYKIHIALFIRDTLGCQRRISDGKRYDACVMYYKSNAAAGLSEHDIKMLENMLEEEFGYSLCLFDRDVLPGRAVADAVLECIDQSRTLVLVPSSSDLGTESGLLSAIHEALVEHQTRLVLIKTESIKKMGSEILQLLSEVGHSVTWKGPAAPSSFFWKHLRYYLPPVQHAPRVSLLPQTHTVKV